MIFGQDAIWYINNSPRILAFQDYVERIESDILPRSIGRLVANAAQEAIRRINSSSNDLFKYAGTDSYPWWYIIDGYDPDKTDVGAYIFLSIPKGRIDWLQPENDSDRPALGLYVYGGGGTKGKATTQRFSKLVQSRIKKPANYEIVCRDNHRGEGFCVMERGLEDVITLEALKEPDKLHKELVELFKSSTIAMLPGLKAVQKAMQVGK